MYCAIHKSEQKNIDLLNEYAFNGRKQITSKLFDFGYMLLEKNEIKGFVLLKQYTYTLSIPMIHSDCISIHFLLLDFVEADCKNMKEIIIYCIPDDKLLECYENLNYNPEYGIIIKSNIVYYKLKKTFCFDKTL